MTEAVVYWIRHPKHNDKETEGYIGVTVRFDERMRDHKNKPHGIMANVVAKYGWTNLIVEVIDSGSEEYCYRQEFALRPTKQIGWNVSEGGKHHGNNECLKQKSARMKTDNPSMREEVKAIRREQLLNDNPIHNPESYAKMVEGVKASRQVKHTCGHCGKSVDIANFKRWHGDNCKEAV